MEQTIHKATVTQDFLYEYLLKHNINLSRLNELMGISNGILMGCFHHDLNNYGKPLQFSAKNIKKMNIAINELANLMRSTLISFGSEQTFTTKHGTTYDPGVLPGMKALSRYFKMNPFCERVLGWNLAKKQLRLCIPASPMYGKISSEDVAKINAEVLAVAGALSGMEIVASDISVEK